MQNSYSYAIKRQKKALLANLNNKNAWKEFSDLHLKRKKAQKLATACEQIIAKYPNYPLPYHYLGVAFEQLGDQMRALQCYRKAIMIAPNLVEALTHAGVILAKLRNYPEAFECFKRAINNGADSVLVHFWYGVLLNFKSATTESEQQFRFALDKDPHHMPSLIYLGKVLMMQAKFDEAMEVYHKAREIDHESVDVAGGIAEIYERKGETESAFEAIRPFLEKSKKDPVILMLYAMLARKLNRESEAISFIEEALSEGSSILDEQKKGLHFKVGHLYDALGNPKKAFEHYTFANALYIGKFNRDLNKRAIEALIEVFDPSFFERFTGAGHESSQPVFIVGMMRSGTSLLEQILSSHPDVVGAGEMEEIWNITKRIGINFNKPETFKSQFSNLDKNSIQDLATTYLNKANPTSVNPIRITDKMPSNFLWLGLIQVLFPNASIIHMQRHPLDTCLSCYANEFVGAHEYAQDLIDLGEYYIEYRRLMDYWKKSLALPILEIRYEDLIEDIESVSRTVLDFCGLEWDDGVLKFYESERLANTVSYNQVRKQIYSSSVGRWRPYEPYLKPLIEELGALIPDAR